ncbi:MAG: hypothetical protein EOP49_52900 [Sphingobacteriales bacterium]|nr:MAG: hypothetical protein EOP49_52900 [Sphingobacteriales bacterium]
MVYDIMKPKEQISNLADCLTVTIRAYERLTDANIMDWLLADLKVLALALGYLPEAVTLRVLAKIEANGEGWSSQESKNLFQIVAFVNYSTATIAIDHYEHQVRHMNEADAFFGDMLAKAMRKGVAC